VSLNKDNALIFDPEDEIENYLDELMYISEVAGQDVRELLEEIRTEQF